MIKKILIQSVLIAALSAPLVHGAETGEVWITKVEGSVSVVTNGQSAPAKEGQAVGLNDVIKTEAGSTADITVNSLVGCRVLASTEASLSDIKKESMQLKLVSGNVVLNIDKLPEKSTFRLETPTAIAAVRGTQFWGRVNLLNPRNPNITFAVREGFVNILTLSTNETFTLREGQALDIPRDLIGRPSVRQALGQEMAALDQASTVRTCS